MALETILLFCLAERPSSCFGLPFPSLTPFLRFFFDFGESDRRSLSLRLRPLPPPFLSLLLFRFFAGLSLSPSPPASRFSTSLPESLMYWSFLLLPFLAAFSFGISRNTKAFLVFSLYSCLTCSIFSLFAFFSSSNRFCSSNCFILKAVRSSSCFLRICRSSSSTLRALATWYWA